MIDSMELTAKFFFLLCSASLQILYVLGTDDNPVTGNEELFEKAYKKGFIAADNN